MRVDAGGGHGSGLLGDTIDAGGNPNTSGYNSNYTNRGSAGLWGGIELGSDIGLRECLTEITIGFDGAPTRSNGRTWRPREGPLGVTNTTASKRALPFRAAGRTESYLGSASSSSLKSRAGDSILSNLVCPAILPQRRSLAGRRRDGVTRLGVTAERTIMSK
jgi:hypothetical protein